MTATTTVRRTAVLAFAAALALTGCSGGDDESGGSKGSDDASEYTPGPLDEYMAKIYGYSFDEAEQQSQDEMQAESDRMNREVEELVAACMSEQGFDYTPVDNSGGTVYSSDDLDVEWGTAEFAEKYGYGISTDPWGMEDQQQEPVEYVDPNQEYVESMSESEQQAYSDALWGPPIEDTGDGEEGVAVEYDWTTAGCYGEAQHEIYDNGMTSTPDEFSALEEEINSRWEQVQADPKMAELDAAWVSCMADAGFSGLTTLNEAQNALYEEWNEVQGWGTEYQELAESWDWEANPDGPPQPEADPAAVSAFTKKEIEQAVADNACQKKVDYQAKSVEIDHASQQEFVDQHKDELEAWVAAAAQARGE